MRGLATEIYGAVRAGRLQEPFNAEMVKKACLGWEDATYPVFLPKHRVGNPGGHTELFIRVKPGFYKTIASLHKRVH